MRGRYHVFIVKLEQIGNIWSVSLPHYPTFGLNTERYRIRSECGKMREKCGPE